MNKFVDSLRDIIYDSIDYIIILGIILVVGLIISWRLDVLFKQDMGTNTIEAKLDENIGKDKSKEDTAKKNEEVSDDSNATTKEEPVTAENKKENNDSTNNANKTLTGETKNITIPSGAISTDIGDILANNGLVGTSSEFNNKAEEMGLSTKLKSGDFTIPVGSSLEDILKIITK